MTLFTFLVLFVSFSFSQIKDCPIENKVINRSIYDIGDTTYELAPSYDWIEIDPDYGGNGTEIDIYDGGNNQDDVTTISLPFAFTFYEFVLSIQKVL